MKNVLTVVLFLLNFLFCLVLVIAEDAPSSGPPPGTPGGPTGAGGAVTGASTPAAGGHGEGDHGPAGPLANGTAPALDAASPNGTMPDMGHGASGAPGGSGNGTGGPKADAAAKNGTSGGPPGAPGEAAGATGKPGAGAGTAAPGSAPTPVPQKGDNKNGAIATGRGGIGPICHFVVAALIMAVIG